MRKTLAGWLLALGISSAAAQAPPPVPALPDTARLTSYNITASTCNCAVGFQLYGDSTDYANWIQVWVNGTQISQSGNWTISSPTGPLATIPRPITDAVLTFTAAQTGTVQIVGARRPRRLSQFQENRGVAARDLNQTVTDIVAENREQWDALLRTVIAPPGDAAIPLILPSTATRASKFLGFDANGGLAVFTPGAGSGGNVVGPASSTNNSLACFNGATGLVIKDCGIGFPIPVASGGTGQVTAQAARAAAGLNIDAYTPRGDSNYTILPTDRTVGTNTALTAARTWTLPAANSVNPGQSLLVADYAGGVTFANTLTIQRAGSDTISISPATTTSVVITSPFGRYEFKSDGVSKWSSGSASASSTQKTPMDYGAVCNGSTDDSTALQAWFNGISGSYVGYIPPGLTCIHTGQLYAKSNSTIYAYNATIKAAAGSGSGTTGIHLSDATWAGAGPGNIKIFGLTYDGNRAARTPPGQAAGIYIINAFNVRLEDVTGQNCVSDCLYAGGTGAFSRSRNITWDKVAAINGYRNSASIAGVDGMQVVNSRFENANGTAPQAGLDAEPDAVADGNSKLFISNSSFEGNAGNGLNIICLIAAQCTAGSGGTMLTANGNGGYGFLASATSTNFRWCGVLGSGGTSGLSSTVTDKCPP